MNNFIKIPSFEFEEFKTSEIVLNMDLVFLFRKEKDSEGYVIKILTEPAKSYTIHFSNDEALRDEYYDKLCTRFSTDL